MDLEESLPRQPRYSKLPAFVRLSWAPLLLSLLSSTPRWKPSPLPRANYPQKGTIYPSRAPTRPAEDKHYQSYSHSELAPQRQHHQTMHLDHIQTTQRLEHQYIVCLNAPMIQTAPFYNNAIKQRHWTSWPNGTSLTWTPTQ